MTYINSITICPENVTVKKGKWYRDTSVEICPTNATCQCVTWHSSNSNVASVIENGDICGVSEGVAVIYATAQDGSGTVGFCNVTVVSPVKVSSVTVTPSTKTVNVGDTFGLSATVCPDNAEDKRIRWTSCDCSVAEVDYLTGCVIAKSAGTTCICANAVDGSGVQGCCEVKVNIPDRGTDSIGVFRMLSMHSAAPDDTETEEPVMRGIQFSDPQNGNYKIRFISQIKTLNYKRVGFEIHSKFGDAALGADIICLDKVYESLLAEGETVYPDEGFEYFVLGVKDNIPQNTVVSFKIKPFAITFEGEFLRGSTMLFSCKDAQQIDSVDFEISEHLNTSAHIRVNTGNGSNLDVMSLPSENGIVQGEFGDGTEIALVLEIPQNEKWYAVYGRTIDGTYKLGWCDGEYLAKETEYVYLKSTDNWKVRSGAGIGYSQLKLIKSGEFALLLDKYCEENNGYYWHKINYNGTIGYVADKKTSEGDSENYIFYMHLQALVGGRPPEAIKTISSACSNFIKSYETFCGTLYYDSAGKPTIGYGHVLGADENYTSITTETAEKLFAKDIEEAQNSVSTLAKTRSVLWNQQQFDAFVSLYFNAGNTAASVMNDIIADMDPYTAFSQASYDANHQFQLGLYRRRMDEADIFVNGQYTREYREAPQG